VSKNFGGLTQKSPQIKLREKKNYEVLTEGGQVQNNIKNTKRL